MTTRPTLSDPATEAEAHAIAANLAAELQQAVELSDADRYDNSFAADILWGSPFGATVTGYPHLNAIHHQLMRDRIAPASTFEVVTATSPAPNVVITQIRRRATDPTAFSELALYILIHRDNHWWLAAAQNTPIDPTRVPN
ncbi:DUF4440 domain-containing protein [Nocardia sp. NPDC004068]|uniref:DUF4440 domain-containing protein n=1 Tax=Nocardia sp. NPDC004068 TaxID=3364303 RepID=UPI0036D1A0E0